MDIVGIKIISILMLPPGSLFVLLLLAWLLRKRYQRSSKVLAGFALVLLYLFSTPLISNSLVRLAENIPALPTQQLNTTDAQAIVVLGAGRYKDAPEYASDAISGINLERLHYAGYLQRHSNLPILTSGGSVYGQGPSEAQMMHDVLVNAYSRQAKWIEGKSRNTAENAFNSAKLLRQSNIDKILLVTHALHMPRARAMFELAGLKVIAAPMGFHTKTDMPFILTLLPDSLALHNSRALFHELIGRLWYALRY